MKFFCYIFSLYFLVLSCLPCNDNEYELLPMAYQTENVATDDHQHENHSHCNDFCSPFCACACCGMTISFQAAFNYTITSRLIPFQLGAQNFFYLSPNSLQSLEGIFQPPQVG